MEKIPKQLHNEKLRFCLVLPKDKKPFESKWQTENNYLYNDDRLIRHIENGGNYGIVGGYSNLLIIDYDDEDIKKNTFDLLPETFTVRTGSGGQHLYFFCDIAQGFVIDDKDGKRLVDFQGRGKQAIAPGSVHPNGKQYLVEKDLPIANIKLKDIKIIFAKYLKLKDRYKQSYDSDHLIQDIKQNVSIRSVLQGYNYDLNKNPTMCLLGHPSKGQKCFSYNESQDLWYCHHCQEGGDIFDLVMKQESCNFPEAKKKLMEIAGIKTKSTFPQKKRENGILSFDEVRCLVLEQLLKEKDKGAKASETITDYILSNNQIHTIRDDEKAEMWIYSEGIYIPHGRSFVREICRQILGEVFSNALGNKVLSKIEVDTFVDQKEFFINENINLIPIKNGIFDLKSKTILPFSEKYKFFNKIPVRYDTSKDCVQIKKFLKSILKDDTDIDVIQELFGYLILREYKIEKAFMFMGFGRNGKGKLIDLMKRFIGAENCANISIQSLEKENFAMGELFNKLANLSADLSKTALEETGRFKSLTGRDLVSAPRKFLPMISFVNYAKMIFSANELPFTKDITQAFFLRWVLVDFPYTFVSFSEYHCLEEEERENFKIADKEIIDRIVTDDEMSGLLNFALEGLFRLLEQGDFSFSKSNKEVKDMWLRRSSSIQAFIMDCVKQKSDSVCPKQEFLEAYLNYCKEHKVNSVGERGIKYALETTVGVVEVRIKKEEFSSERIRCWKGIILKNLENGNSA